MVALLHKGENNSAIKALPRKATHRVVCPLIKRTNLRFASPGRVGWGQMAENR